MGRIAVGKTRFPEARKLEARHSAESRKRWQNNGDNEKIKNIKEFMGSN